MKKEIVYFNMKTAEGIETVDELALKVLRTTIPSTGKLGILLKSIGLLAWMSIYLKELANHGKRW